MKKENKSKNILLEDIFNENIIEGNVINLNKVIQEEINQPNISIYKPNNYNNSIHYDSNVTLAELVGLTGDTEDIRYESYAQFPLFFESNDKIYIPTKVEALLNKYISKVELRKINKDIEVAKELCLMFLSNLSNCFYSSNDGWKRLRAKELREQLGDTSNIYLKIIELLLKGSSKGAVIERNNFFEIGEKSREYRLAEGYLNKGVVTYELKTNHAKNLRRKNYFRLLNKALENPIAKNLINVYQTIDLPSIEEIELEAKRLVKSKYLTKKGKKLTFLNKHNKSYWKDSDNRSFVEENIELFLRLTQNGFLIPMVGDSKSGGRVVDSFTLMPSWIRNLCKINGKKIEEADYSALHPNIAMNIYKGNSEYITHDKVAEDANIDKTIVKVEHLSFFNKTWDQMYKSPLFSFYSDKESNMMENIFKDKDMFGHKITSKKLFKIEVDIMTSVIEELNSEGIYVGYVYDALFCNPKQKERVLEVMNKTVIKFGIKTIAK